MKRLLTVAAALVLVVGFASATFLAVRQPLSLGDYLAIWGLKARAIHASGELSATFRVDPTAEYSHPEYPPLWPLLLAGTAKLLGRYDELLLTLLRPLLLVLAAGLTFLRTRAPLPWRLLAAGALTLLPYFQTAAYTGYAEALLLVFVLAALYLLERPSPGTFTPAVAGLLLACASLTKQEGVVFLFVVVVLLAAARRRREAVIAGGIGLGLGVLPWSLYRAAHGVRSLAVYGFDALDAEKPLRALATLGDLALPSILFWLLGAALLFTFAPVSCRLRLPLLAGAAIYSTLLLLSFAFARPDVAWLVRWSWDRLALLPVAALLPAVFEAAAEPFETCET
jgi:hypothetical protein